MFGLNPYNESTMSIKRMLVLISVIFFMGLFGCAPFLSNTEVGVYESDNEKLMNGCKFKGTVKGAASFGLTKAYKAEIAMNDLRKQAKLLGADTVLIVSKESMFKETSIMGRAYDCPPQIIIQLTD